MVELSISLQTSERDHAGSPLPSISSSVNVVLKNKKTPGIRLPPPGDAVDPFLGSGFVPITQRPALSVMAAQNDPDEIC
jgi:hypothetical protein